MQHISLKLDISQLLKINFSNKICQANYCNTLDMNNHRYLEVNTAKFLSFWNKNKFLKLRNNNYQLKKSLIIPTNPNLNDYRYKTKLKMNSTGKKKTFIEKMKKIYRETINVKTRKTIMKKKKSIQSIDNENPMPKQFFNNWDSIKTFIKLELLINRNLFKQVGLRETINNEVNYPCFPYIHCPLRNSGDIYLAQKSYLFKDVTLAPLFNDETTSTANPKIVNVDNVKHKHNYNDNHVSSNNCDEDNNNNNKQKIKKTISAQFWSKFSGDFQKSDEIKTKIISNSTTTTDNKLTDESHLNPVEVSKGGTSNEKLKNKSLTNNIEKELLLRSDKHKYKYREPFTIDEVKIKQIKKKILNKLEDKKIGKNKNMDVSIKMTSPNSQKSSFCKSLFTNNEISKDKIKNNSSHPSKPEEIQFNSQKIIVQIKKYYKHLEKNDIKNPSEKNIKKDLDFDKNIASNMIQSKLRKLGYKANTNDTNNTNKTNNALENQVDSKNSRSVPQEK